MFSSPVWVRGYAPLPRFFCLQGLVCLFYSKNRFIYYDKEHFDTNFCFFITFLRPLHIRAKVSLCERKRPQIQGVTSKIPSFFHKKGPLDTQWAFEA
ncbi:hypothetical protein BREVNS_1375 [Brevinematales bacterium NS]|nr:hypothetical protein BREVNS_1375 [Brevinematales bacterium NS]